MDAWNRTARFTGTVALWWNYFERAEGIAVEATATPEDAGAVDWWGTMTLTLLVLALIAIAVGDALAIVDPGDDATLGFTLLTFGGPALFLLAQAVFLHATLGHVPARDCSRCWRSRSSRSPPRRSR